MGKISPFFYIKKVLQILTNKFFWVQLGIKFFTTLYAQMANTLNNLNITGDKSDLLKLNKKELQEKMDQAKATNNLDEMIRIASFMKQVREWEATTKALDKEHKALMDEILAGKGDPDKIAAFVKTELTKRKSDKEDRQKKIKAFQNTEKRALERKLKWTESDYKKQLEEKDKIIAEKDATIKEYEDDLDDLPSLLDVFSPKSKRLAQIWTRLKEIKDKLPTKDVLIYCMTAANGIFFGKTRWWIKRTHVKLRKKRKTASIVQGEDLKKIKAMLAPDEKSKWKWKERLKRKLLKTINEQQAKYAEEVKAQIIA